MSPLVPNRPTAAGRDLGADLARVCDVAEAEQRKRFPNMAERCSSCAFRAGTVPNGCPETLMDAIKCVIEQREFMCHMGPGIKEGKPTLPCAGWFTLLSGDAERVEAPWKFSHEPADAEGSAL